MADLKSSTAAALTVAKAATEPTEVVRKQEFDSTVSTLATAASVQSVANEQHAAVTVVDTNSVNLVIDEQQLSANVRLSTMAVLQEAGGPAIELFGHPIVAGITITLAKQVATVQSIERFTIDDELMATGVSGTDYDSNVNAGTIYIRTGSNLVTEETQYVKVIYTYGEQSDGPGLLLDASNLRVDFGETHETVARGDHVHANDHSAAVGVDTQSVSVTVTPSQVVSATVTIAPAGNLESTASGLRVLPTSFAAASHTHSNATTNAAGFMSAADKQKLDLVGSSDAQYSDSDTVNFTVNEGIASADVRLSTGLTSTENGVAVDFSVVAEADHAHDVAGSSTAGFMSADQSAALAAVRYTYVGYCDDIIGSGTEQPVNFSTTIDTDKRYLAILVSETSITSLQASDFAGLWFSIMPFGAS